MRSDPAGKVILAIVEARDNIHVALCRCMVSRDGAVEEKTCNTEASKARAVVP